jgi:hypothetical protein
MNKKEELQKVESTSKEVAKIEHPVNEIQISAERVQDLGLLLSDEVFESSQGVEITSTYMKSEDWNKDVPVKVIVDGFTTIEGTINGVTTDVEAVTFYAKSEEGEPKKYLSAASVLVSAFKKVPKIPCAAIITYTGKKKGSSGTPYDDFSVKLIAVFNN